MSLKTPVQNTCMLDNDLLEFSSDLSVELLQELPGTRALSQLGRDERVDGVQPLLLDWSRCAVFYTLLHEGVVHLKMAPESIRDKQQKAFCSCFVTKGRDTHLALPSLTTHLRS